MRYITGFLFFLLVVCSVNAQQSEFDSLIRLNKIVPGTGVEQQLYLFDNEAQVESLHYRTTYYENGKHHDASSLEIFSGNKYKVILEHESGKAFILPVSDSLHLGRGFDSLLVEKMVDSLGLRTPLDSQNFYLDVSFIPEHPYESIRFFYDRNYQISGYNLIYNPQGKISRHIQCRMTYSLSNERVFDWSALIMEKDGAVSLTPKYKNYKLINLLAY